MKMEKHRVTSNRKARANRTNARRSTGPKTPHGRSRSAKNAFRHGLSLPVQLDPQWSDEVQTIAQQIAGPEASAELQELARRIAEAHVDLRRVRDARHRLLSNALKRPSGPDPRSIDDVGDPPHGAMKVAAVLSEETRTLLVVTRYERRALSRRKFAIRAFDAARKMQTKA